MKEISSTLSVQEIKYETTRNGDTTVKIIRDGRAYYLHSPYDPVREARRFAEIIHRSGFLHIIIGVGLGYMLSALKAQAIEEDRFVLIEPMNELYEYINSNENIRYYNNDERIKIFKTTQRDEIQRHLGQLFHNGYLSRFRIDVAPNYRQIAGNEIAELERWILELVRIHQVNFNTIINFSLQWHYNYLLNMQDATISTPFNAFKSRWNIPAIILGAGPSLAKALPYLHRLREHVLLVAAGSSITTLVRYGVRPHLVVSIDGMPANHSHFKRVPDLDIPLFYSPMIYYKILRQYLGSKVIFQVEQTPFQKWYNEKLGFDPGFASAGPSVANVALDLVRQMTTGPITFVGQDLGYTGGYSHAPDHPHRRLLDDIIQGGKKMLEVEANDGSMLKTDYVYLSMKRWFESFVLLHQLGDRVYNSTAQGAKIEGIPFIALDEFEERYAEKKVDLDNEINEIIQNNRPQTPQKLMFAEEYNLLRNVSVPILNARKVARELNGLITESKRIDTKRIQKIVQRLDRLDAEIRSRTGLDKLLGYLISALHEKIQTAIIDSDSDDSLVDDKKIARKNVRFYTDLYRAIRITRLIIYFMSRKGDCDGTRT